MPGILNWALTGCLNWQQNGLQEPEVIQASTHDYESEMDDLGQFIDEYCEIGDNFQAPATALYEAFLEAMPDCHVNQKTFGGRLTMKGFSRERMTSGSNKGKYAWHGLRLRTDAVREWNEQLAQALSDAANSRQVVNGEP